MSEAELSRLDVVRDLERGHLTDAEAAKLLRLERRQVFRLLKVYRAEDAAGLISKRRGRIGNRAKPDVVRYAALKVIRERSRSACRRSASGTDLHMIATSNFASILGC